MCGIGAVMGMAMGFGSIWQNVCCALVLLRIFIFWDVSLRFLFMIKSAFASLSALFVVMFCVFFSYGTIGVTLFKARTPAFAEQQDYMKDRYGNANFASLENAMITLVQGFVGEAFHELMMATKAADVYDEVRRPAEFPKGDNWIICFYIISYFLIMTLLFGNLFFGLLLSIFGCLYDVHQSGQQLTNHTIKKASQLRLIDPDDEDSDAVVEGSDTAGGLLGDEGAADGAGTHIGNALRLLQGEQQPAEQSAARKLSVTLDIIEPIPEEMASHLSADGGGNGLAQSAPTKMSIDTVGMDGDRALTPTATEMEMPRNDDEVEKVENAR